VLALKVRDPSSRQKRPSVPKGARNEDELADYPSVAIELELEHVERRRTMSCNNKLSFLREMFSDISYHIASVIAVFVVLVCKSRSQKPQEVLSLSVTEERYRALFYMPLHTFSHSLHNVLVQTANEAIPT
jgi:hypothetical protein